MDTKPLSKHELIAPCGMNCGVCMAYLRKKNKCDGCRTVEGYKLNHCVKCAILNCVLLKDTESKFCYECVKFPCTRMKQLDKRYRLKYNSSFLVNLEKIKTEGLDAFVQSESMKWKCPSCGGTVCIHTQICSTCN